MLVKHCINFIYIVFKILFKILELNFSPCFDEPALKASYKIIIEHPKDSIALSNWPVLVFIV
jgi:hypothetical protein